MKTEDSTINQQSNFLETEDDDSDGIYDDDDMIFYRDVTLPAENADASFANEFQRLSIKERENALHEIHGIADQVEETDELVTRSLKSMEQCLERKLRRKEARSYNEAMRQSLEFVQQKDLRLRFLRAAEWDAEAASISFLHHFRIKLDLFGVSKLCKDITLNDLGPEDLKCLENGHFQVLPVRDSVGRVVVTHFPGLAKYDSFENVVRFGALRRTV